MTLYQRLRMKHGLYWNTGHHNRVFWHNVVSAVIIGVLLALLSFQVRSSDSTVDEVRRLREQLNRAEAQLLGCLNGSYTGVYYYKGNRRYDIVCDRPAFEIQTEG